MLNEDLLRQALRDAELPDDSVQYADELESTNTKALTLAAAGAPEWTLVAAGRQTAGRGRLGRRWESPPSGGLSFSFVLRPTLPAEATPLITLLAGRSIASACSDTGLSANVRCKWPNDLLLDEAKVGGILVEARIREGAFDHVVVGVGLNLGSAPPIEGSGALPTGDPAGLLASFLAEFGHDYRYGPPETFPQRVVGLYRPLCATLGRPVRAITVDGRVVEGVAEDIDARGNLVIAEYLRKSVVGFGEVEHLR